MKNDLIPPEAKAMISKEAAPQIYEITKRDIRRFAQAIGEPNPLYADEDYARQTKWGGIIAPPLFIFALAYEDVPATQLRADGLPIELDIPLPATRAVGGASAIELGEPIKPGDTITVNKRVTDIYPKEGKSGILYFTIIETTFTNQKSQFVAREKATFIQR